MKVFCLRYHGNGGAKLQAKVSFPLLLVPSLISRARTALNLLQSFTSLPRDLYQIRVLGPYTSILFILFILSFTPDLFISRVQTAEEGHRTGIRQAVQIQFIYPAAPAL